MCPQKTHPYLQCSSVKNRPWQIYIRYMLCICVYQNVWIFDKMYQKCSLRFCIYVSPQNKTTRKSCSHVTDATTCPKPAGQPPKIFQIIHVNNWLWQNCYLQEILNELMVMSENGVTLALSILADICHSYFNLALWYFKYGEKAYVKCEWNTNFNVCVDKLFYIFWLGLQLSKYSTNFIFAFISAESL